MKTQTNTNTINQPAMVYIPLASLSRILRYPKEKKVLFEVSAKELKKVNDAETIDEIINEARLDYATGNYKTFTNTKDLIAELRS